MKIEVGAGSSIILNADVYNATQKLFFFFFFATQKLALIAVSEMTKKLFKLLTLVVSIFNNNYAMHIESLS